MMNRGVLTEACLSFSFFYSNSKLNRYLKGFGGIGGKIGRD
jgi:hypothetical protein